jgi:hypothetical protein
MEQNELKQIYDKIKQFKSIDDRLYGILNDSFYESTVNVLFNEVWVNYTELFYGVDYETATKHDKAIEALWYSADNFDDCLKFRDQLIKFKDIIKE